MTADKKQTLRKASSALATINSNLHELGKAILDCAQDENIRNVCLESILSARASVMKAQIYLDNLTPKGNELAQ